MLDKSIVLIYEIYNIYGCRDTHFCFNEKFRKY